MEGKVIMYDANGTEIGETYTRRARQLVKQQRAIWADDTHTAISFMPDTVEDWELTPPPAPSSTHTPTPEIDRTSTLYAIAAKRMRDRRRIIWHSLALVPVFIIIFIWGITSYHATRHGGEGFLIFMGFSWGVWITAYINHLRAYLKNSDYIPRSTRRKILLDAEVDRLRRMGYTE